MPLGGLPHLDWVFWTILSGPPPKLKDKALNPLKNSGNTLYLLLKIVATPMEISEIGLYPPKNEGPSLKVFHTFSKYPLFSIVSLAV